MGLKNCRQDAEKKPSRVQNHTFDASYLKICKTGNRTKQFQDDERSRTIRQSAFSNPQQSPTVEILFFIGAPFYYIYRIIHCLLSSITFHMCYIGKHIIMWLSLSVIGSPYIRRSEAT